MSKSRIEWTESTWNPITGCTKISSGCRFCYAEIMARRLQAMGQPKYADGFKLTIHPDTLDEPYTWKKPRVVFVNSMSDIFHKDVPIEFIQKIFKVINDNPQHVFQVLTKRADVLYKYDSEGLLNWSDNLWMGVTVESSKVTKRIDFLRRTGAHVKFLSCEPLISAIPNMNLSGIDWVITGGESGRTPRPIDKEWVLDIKQQCDNLGVAFYFKQWGGTNKKKSGRMIDGVTYDAMPRSVTISNTKTA